MKITYHTPHGDVNINNKYNPTGDIRAVEYYRRKTGITEQQSFCQRVLARIRGVR